MTRGTTPTHTLTVPVDVATVSKATVAYAQFGKVIIKKSPEACEISGTGTYTTVTVHLTQEETLKFNQKEVVEIQMKILFTDGNVALTNISRVSTNDCLDEEILE